MTNKWILWIGTLAFSAMAIAGPKAYSLTLAAPMEAGNMQLSAGEYKVKVEGSNAVFTDVQTHKSLSVPVTTQNSGKKYSATALETTMKGGMEHLNAIELGGSTMKLEFGE